MENNRNQYALVTGATSGIGYELAKLFAQKGYSVVAVARSPENLQRVAEELRRYRVEAHTIPTDLFGENAGTELYEEVKRRRIQVDVLVNAAGQGVYGLFDEMDIEGQIRIMQLNAVSLTRLTYYFLKDMKARNSGKILQVSSALAEIPTPYQAVYAATKAYVLSLSEALASELEGTSVTITTLMPGLTETDFFNKAGAQDAKVLRDKSRFAHPAQVARDGYSALMAGRTKVVSGTKNKFLSALGKVTPNAVLANILKKQAGPVNKRI